ncbi:MAG: Lrp/AsnC ligand binding domain-containing protein [Actinomycetota bacterium]
MQTEVAMAATVSEKIACMDEIDRADSVVGAYEVIAHAEAPTMDDLSALVAHKMRGIEGVARIITCPLAA